MKYHLRHSIQLIGDANVHLQVEFAWLNLLLQVLLHISIDFRGRVITAHRQWSWIYLWWVLPCIWWHYLYYRMAPCRSCNSQQLRLCKKKPTNRQKCSIYSSNFHLHICNSLTTSHFKILPLSWSCLRNSAQYSCEHFRWFSVERQKINIAGCSYRIYVRAHNQFDVLLGSVCESRVAWVRDSCYLTAYK